MKLDASGPLLPPTAATAGGQQAVAALRPLHTTKPVADAGSAAPSASPQLASTSADFDAAKVAAIRQSINAGLYQVNVENLADGLLASVHELLNAQRP